MGTAPPAPPTRAYTGPSFLRNTVGSLVGLRQSSYAPQLVGGIGIVLLPAGSNTGCTNVPPYIRQWLINRIRKMGVGSANRSLPKTPSAELFLADPRTAVVTVEGFLPAGGTVGTRFDVLVSALDGTDTTSLAGGELWTVEMGLDGTERDVRHVRPLAEARGPIYLNPFDNRTDEDQDTTPVQRALVVAGGRMIVDRPLQLMLNQPSYQRARLVSDRINERFGKPTDLRPISNPRSDQLIQLNVPDRWANQTELMLDLITHLYLRTGPRFEPTKAEQLAQVLLDHPRQYSFEVVMAWRALGRTVIPTLQSYYDSPVLEFKLAALEAGAWLEDERASQNLAVLATHENSSIRTRVAESLVYLPRSLRGERALKSLLDDEDQGVRLAAYESLALIKPDWLSMERVLIADEIGQKFAIDRVPSKRPLIYVTQEHFPRLVIFGPQLGFNSPLLARLWGNRLMVRTPTTIRQALVGIKIGQTAHIPIIGRSPIQATPGGWVTEVIDHRRELVTMRVPTDLREAVDQQLSTSGDTPAVATVRVLQLSADHVSTQLIGLVEGHNSMPLTVFFQPRNQYEAITYHNIYPSVSALAYILGHGTVPEVPHQGLDFTYSQVVDVVYRLCQQGHIDAPFHARVSPLAGLVRQSEDEGPELRPETVPEESGDGMVLPVGETMSRPEIAPRIP